MKFEIEHQGKKHLVRAQWIGGRLWYHINGVTRLLEPKARHRRQGAASTRDEITAPMPGKITKVLKGIGDPVNSGDVVLVMEAMKMEYSLKSEINGQIVSIDCHIGDQVPLGHRLAKIQPSTAASGER